MWKLEKTNKNKWEIYKQKECNIKFWSIGVNLDAATNRTWLLEHGQKSVMQPKKCIWFHFDNSSLSHVHDI